MAFAMTRPTRRADSRNLQYQARVPVDVADKARGTTVILQLPGSDDGGAVGIAINIGSVVKFSLQTADPAMVKARTGAATAQLARHWQSLRNGPKPLTHKQMVALSGEIYRLFVSRFEDNPGTPGLWAAVKGFNRATREGRLDLAPRLDAESLGLHLKAAEAFGPGLTDGINSLPESLERAAGALEKRFGWLADWVLTKEAITTDQDSRAALLVQVESAATDAAWQLKRNASGDYAPDAKAQRFPTVERVDELPAALSFHSLFEQWADARTRAPSSIRRWRHVVTRQFPEFLAQHAGHQDPARVTKSDVVAWRDALLKGGASARTVKGASIAAINAVFGKAKADDRLANNPAVGVVVDPDRKTVERDKGFTDLEAATILTAARNLKQGQRDAKTFAFIRWAPFIAAATGARIGEIAQLRKGDFTRDAQGGWTMQITPEAGTTKNSKARSFPVSAALVDEGLCSFVLVATAGPLFFTGGEVSKKVPGLIRKIGDFVRKEAGIADPRVAPNHGWRHRFVTKAREVGMSEEHREYILGHAGRGIGVQYGDMAGLRREIEKLPPVVLDM